MWQWCRNNQCGTGKLIYRQQVLVQSAIQPAQVGQPIMNYNFKIDPPENAEICTFNNDAGGFYNLAASASESIGFGTVSTASLLILQPIGDVVVQFINSFIISGTLTDASAAVTSVSSLEGLSIGDEVSGIGIPDDTTIIALSTTGFTLSANATAAGAGVALTIVGTGKPLYVNGGQSSIFNMNFVGMILTNPLTGAVTSGRYYIAGV